MKKLMKKMNSSINLINSKTILCLFSFILFSFFITQCTSRPKASTAKINGKFEFQTIDPSKDKKNGPPAFISTIETLNDQTVFSRIVSIALGSGQKNTAIEVPIQFVVDFKGKPLVLSINIKKRAGEKFTGKSSFLKQLTETNFSYIINNVTYLADFGHVEIDKIRFGEKGFVKGRFFAEFAGGFFSGEFHVIIDETKSSYQG